MKKIIYMAIVLMALSNLIGCRKKVSGSERFPEDDLTNQSTVQYIGDSGWSVEYDEQSFSMNEISKGKDIELNYTGKCKGSTYVGIVEIQGRTAKEIIKEKQAEFDKTSEIYEVKNDSKTGYVFYAPGIGNDARDGNGRFTSVEVITLKDGVLVITASQMTDDEMKVSDNIADIINSIEI